jgi:rhamnogalacturonyl hydrolase YesR
MIGRVLAGARALRAHLSLPPAARAERRLDRRAGPGPDPGRDAVAAAAIGWLVRAQDQSATHDGGVARHFSLVSGWGPSYPETTGYIIPTMLEAADRSGDAALRERARRMLDWLVSIQLEGGAFQAGTVDATPRVPEVFNTGQILLGLTAGVRAFGDAYLPAMRAAADWLVAAQDPDGAWRRHLTPFAAPGEKTYHTHVGWSLVQAARLEPHRQYAEAALQNARWALTQQTANGWFPRCHLGDADHPLTHTVGYALRGIIEVYRFAAERELLAAARRTADGLLTALRPSGFLAGSLDRDWHSTDRWACLTGSAQIAHCWLQLFQDTGDSRYRDAALLASRWVRSTVRVDGPDDTRGGVKGSFPVSGAYEPYEYLNWAAKFVIDQSWLEQEVCPTAR